MFEDGRLVEYGSHDELMAASGKYAGMFNTQAQYYRENPDGGESGVIANA
jgi:ABC-type transport system involved in cytochrome bd biosynthesis fused ATPase/permease subunit